MYNPLKYKKIFIAGHRGMVGSALLRYLKKQGAKKLILVTRKKLDLLNHDKVYKFIKYKKPDVIINCAGRVGGILANSKYPVEFLNINIMIQLNLINAAYQNKIQNFINLGSSCIYPKKAKQPIKENYLLSSSLEKTNEAYALAKISGIKLSEYLFSQHKLDIICLMPTNLYGINDNFDKFSSHVIPGMIAKFIEAKKNKKKMLNYLVLENL